LSEEYKNRAPEDENDRLTISSSSIPPSALGNALLPPAGANWAAERRKIVEAAQVIGAFHVSVSANFVG
jgi:hypothetical protein